MDNVGIVVDDLAEAIAFFRELGLDLEGQGMVEGEWAGRVTGLGDQRETGVPVSLTELTLFQKQLRGSLFGACAPTRDIPRLAQLWRTGAVALEPLVTRRYALDEIDEGYRDLREGRTLRGVLVLDPELVTP